MTVCTECWATEQGTITLTDDDGHDYEVCACCEMEDTLKNYDEDYGQER